MKKLAIIAFGHPESTLPLVKYLSEIGNRIDYYYVSFLGTKQVPAFNFNGMLIRPGISKLSHRRVPSIYNYFNNKIVSINLIGLFPSSYVSKLNGIVMNYVGHVINRQNYDAINIIGNEVLLMDLHKVLKNGRIFHTLHEVTDHFSGTETTGKLLSYLLFNKIRIIVPSRVTYDRLLKIDKCIENQVNLIPFGLFETYRLFDLNQDTSICKSNTILFYGAILPYKGLNVLLEAVEILKQRSYFDFKVIIAGKGEIKDRARLEDDKNFLIINRYISNEEIVTLNKQAMVVICPYITASQSGIVMTSFLFGKPVIASDVGAFSEVITNLYNGLLIPPNSAEILADNILKLFTNKDLYNYLCSNVKKFGESDKYNWKVIAKSTLNAYFNQGSDY